MSLQTNPNDSDDNISNNETKSPHNADNKISQQHNDYDGYIFAKPKRVRKKRMSKGKKIALIILITLLSLALLVVGTVATLHYIGKNALLEKSDEKIDVSGIADVEVEDNLRTITYKGVKYTLNPNITTILAMGIDKQNLDEAEAGTAGQADMIIAIAHDTENGKTTAINIPRDTITDIDLYDVSGNYVGAEKKQICLAYAYGDGREKSCENVKKSVSNLLFGTKINSYFTLDLAAVPVLNDAVGGIQLKSLETIEPFTEGEDLWLFGEDATTYVRKRNMNVLNANLLRNKRQAQYLGAFVDKVVSKTKEDITTPLMLFDLMNDYMITDIDAGKVTFIATNALTKNFSGVEFKNVPGNMVKAEPYVEYHYDEEGLFKLYLDVYYNVVE